jgi:Lipase (class 3)
MLCTCISKVMAWPGKHQRCRHPAPSIYVGRPCYLALADSSRTCDAYWWTFGRYSDDVVASLAQAVVIQMRARYPSDHPSYPSPDKKLTLIGHSGGGALAVLMAPHLAQTHAVVTLAGNLDTDAWSGYHHYLPLTGSLNPAAQPPLSTAIAQWHFAAAKDDTIPLPVIRQFCARQVQHAPDRKLTCDTVAGTTHLAGWQDWWPAFVTTLD